MCNVSENVVGKVLIDVDGLIYFTLMRRDEVNLQLTLLMVAACSSTLNVVKSGRHTRMTHICMMHICMMRPDVGEHDTYSQSQSKNSTPAVKLLSALENYLSQFIELNAFYV